MRSLIQLLGDLQTNKIVASRCVDWSFRRDIHSNCDIKWDSVVIVILEICSVQIVWFICVTYANNLWSISNQANFFMKMS